MKQARKSKTAAGIRLLELLESRLDNAVFRAGFAPTIPAARQLVNHGHFLLNGRKTDIPSAQIKQGDVIALREKSKNLEIIKESLSKPSIALAQWLTVEIDEKKFTISATPDAESVPFPVEVQQVVEYYNTRM